jgi:hypothetical protein
MKQHANFPARDARDARDVAACRFPMAPPPDIE